MKKLLFILMLIPIVGIAQIEPYGHVELLDSRIKIHEIAKNAEFNFPNLSVKIGLKYTYKRLYIAADSEVFSNYYSGLNLTPELTFYDFKFGYKISEKIHLRYEHRCIHEITAHGKKYAQRMFGGFDKIGVYFN